jgi:hypothetical protein
MTVPLNVPSNVTGLSIARGANAIVDRLAAAMHRTDPLSTNRLSPYHGSADRSSLASR